MVVVGLLVVAMMIIVPSATNVFGVEFFTPAPVQISSSGENISFGDFGKFEMPRDLFVDGTDAYITWSQNTVSDNQNLFFSKSTDGLTWSTPLLIDLTSGGTFFGFQERLVHVSGTNVDIFYSKTVGSGGQVDLKIARSTNGGTSFGTPVVIEALPLREDEIWVDIDQDNIVLVYHDPTASLLKFKRSSDGGATFPTELTIDDGTGGAGQPSLNSWDNLFIEQSSDGTNIWIAFEASDGSDNSIFSVNSTDSGTSFSSPVLVSDEGVTENEGGFFKLEIFADGTNVLITYAGIVSSTATYSQVRSTDNGLTYASQENIELGTLCDWGYSRTRLLDQDTVDPSVLHVICNGEGAGAKDMLTSVTTDLGGTWSSFTSFAEDPLDSTEQGEELHVSVTGDTVFYTWIGKDDNAGDSAERQLLVNSTNAGVTFSTETEFNETETGFLGNWRTTHLQTSENALYFALQDGTNKTLWSYAKTLTVNTIPVITITGDTVVEITLGDDYTELGATATDNEDGDISSSVVIGGDTVDTNTVDAYFVTYNVDDSQGESAVEKIRTVIVVTAPTAGGGGAPTGSPVSTSEPEVTDSQGFTEQQRIEFDEAIANAIASIPLTQDSIIEEIIQTFFEFTVVDKEHDGLQLQSFLDNERLGLRWSTGDDIVIVDITPSASPFLFSFEQLPVVKQGSGAFVSTDFLTYDLDVPRTACGDVITFDCVNRIRYEVPITVQAVIDGIGVQDTGTITVDLTEDDIDIILLLVIVTGLVPVVAILIQRARGKKIPLTTTRRLQG